MDFELLANSDAGRQFVALAEKHAPAFFARADQHDRDGTFPFENIDELRRCGVMAACVPEEFGGLGVESVHDYIVGMNRLGRGDGSTAIAANMHIARPWRLARAWRGAASTARTRQAERLGGLLRRIGRGDEV